MMASPLLAQLKEVLLIQQVPCLRASYGFFLFFLLFNYKKKRNPYYFELTKSESQFYISPWIDDQLKASFAGKTGEK